ncbi:MAG: hypothetical protein ACM35G_02950, partial [Planctomycetaceae bacterium]
MFAASPASSARLSSGSKPDSRIERERRRALRAYLGLMATSGAEPPAEPETPRYESRFAAIPGDGLTIT